MIIEIDQSNWDQTQKNMLQAAAYRLMFENGNVSKFKRIARQEGQNVIEVETGRYDYLTKANLEAKIASFLQEAEAGRLQEIADTEVVRNKMLTLVSDLTDRQKALFLERLGL